MFPQPKSQTILCIRADKSILLWRGGKGPRLLDPYRIVCATSAKLSLFRILVNQMLGPF